MFRQRLSLECHRDGEEANKNKVLINSPIGIRPEVFPAQNSTPTDGMIVHLINLTGFSGNTYFRHLSVYKLEFKIQSDFKPSAIFSWNDHKQLDFQMEQ